MDESHLSVWLELSAYQSVRLLHRAARNPVILKLRSYALVNARPIIIGRRDSTTTKTHVLEGVVKGWGGLMWNYTGRCFHGFGTPW